MRWADFIGLVQRAGVAEDDVLLWVDINPGYTAKEEITVSKDENGHVSIMDKTEEDTRH